MFLVNSFSEQVTVKRNSPRDHLINVATCLFEEKPVSTCQNFDIRTNSPCRDFYFGRVFSFLLVNQQKPLGIVSTNNV